MKTFQRFTLFAASPVFLLCFLNLSIIKAQEIPSCAESDNKVIPIQSDGADRSPEPGNPNLPPSDALYDLIWKAHTHDYPTTYDEAGIETDGTYIYTTRWNTAGAFFRYNMTGFFVDGFTISGAGAIRDLAYDAAAGRFYGGKATTTVYEMDFTNFTLVSMFTAPTAVRAIAWDSDLNIFYANNWSTAITKFTKAGVSQGSFACGPVGQSYFGFAYCPVGVCSGPLLYGYAQTGPTSNHLIEIALPAGVETGNYKDMGAELQPLGTGVAGGLAFFHEITWNGKALLGLCQSQWIWAAKLCGGCPYNNDVGVSAIAAPVSGWNLGTAEPVTITIKNFGYATQSNIPVNVTLDGGAPQTGILPGPLNGLGTTANYTFPLTVNLSIPGQTCVIAACTQLTNDQYPYNDCKTEIIQNQTGIYCAAGATICDEYINNVILNTINNPSGCGLVGGYSDYTALSTTLSRGVPYDITVHNPLPYTGDVVDCWIDWEHDNWDAGDYIPTTTSDYMTFTGTFTVPITVFTGETRLRVRIYYYPAAADPCGTSTYGEVEDYTVDIFCCYTHDVGVQSIDAPVGAVTLGPVTPLATVRNIGFNSETFPVNMTIDSYTSTKTVTNLAPGATQQIAFDTWTPIGSGTHTLTACTQLLGDEQPANDCKSDSTIMIYNSKAYAYSAYDPSGALPEGPVWFYLEDPGNITSLGPTQSTQYITSGTWVPSDRWLVAEYDDGSTGGGLWQINQLTGSMTYLCDLNVQGTLLGLSWCWNDGYLYGQSYAGGHSYWYKIDPGTYLSTLITDMGSGYLFMGLAYDMCYENFYTVNISDDCLYSIDKDTGYPTLIGSTGLPMNYAQDLELSANDCLLYAASYASSGKLAMINTTTGNATIIGDFQGGAQITGFAFRFDPCILEVELKLFLEGPYNPASSLMDATLNNNGFLPLYQPFNPPLPYYGNSDPSWLYDGLEQVQSIPNANVVDWVLVETRSSPDPINTTGRAVGFVLKNGKVVHLDGTNGLFFLAYPEDAKYIVVYHRNHQAVMNATPPPIISGMLTWDFTTGPDKYFGGANAAKELEPGVWGARSGDGNGDNQTDNDDKLSVWRIECGSSGYRGGDYNLNGQVDNEDKIEFWSPNSGTSSQVPE
jgi:hypothetical protein